MGDPPKLRNKYSRPQRLWDMERLGEEKALKEAYGLKNMREIWLAMAVLKKYRREARRLLSLTEEERREDAEKILARLQRMGLLTKNTALDDILSLGVKDVLERRLQSIVLRKGLAYTMPQSRQLITHGYIALNGRRISSPSYLVYKEQESHIVYAKKIDIRPPKQPVETAGSTEEKIIEKPEPAEKEEPKKE